MRVRWLVARRAGLVVRGIAHRGAERGEEYETRIVTGEDGVSLLSSRRKEVTPTVFSAAFQASRTDSAVSGRKPLWDKRKPSQSAIYGDARQRLCVNPLETFFVCLENNG